MIVGILGMTRQGKTTLTKRLIREPDRAIVVDPLGKLGHMGVAVRSVDEFKAYWRRNYGRRWKIVLQPGKIAPDVEPRQALAPFLRIARNVALGGEGFWVFVDEVDKFGNAFSADREIRAIADYGGNFGVSLAFNARRPACIDKTLCAQADTLYVFRTKEPRDVAYFRDVIGGELADKLPELKQFHALRCTGRGHDAVVIDVRDGGGSGGPERPPEGPDSPGEGGGGGGGILDASDSPAGGDADAPPANPFAGPTVVLTLKELAARFAYASPTKFRVALIDSGRLPVRRHGLRRFEVPLSSLPQAR